MAAPLLAGATLANPLAGWAGRAIPLWMQKLSRWGGATSKRNPFTGPRPSGTRSPTLRETRGLKGRGKLRIDPETGRVLNTLPGRMDKGGLFFRNPKRSFWAAAAGGPAAAATAYGLLSGDDKPDEETTGPSRADLMRKREQAENDALAAKQPSMSAGHRTDYLKKRKKRLQKGMKQLLNQYMILSAVSPEQADNFLKAGMKMMETDQEFNDDLQIQDAYDTVFQPGNMPTSGRDAFAKLLPYVGKKDAMAIAGDWSDLVPDYKEYNYMTKQRMEMRDVVALANAGDRSGAIALLIQGWQSGSFKTMPDHLKMGQATQEEWVKEASKAIDLMTTGSVGGEAEDPLIKGIVG
jgi:hypothetical protein